LLADADVASLIAYECVAPVHRATDAKAKGALTVHQGEWAYCVSEELSHHEWRPTGGLALADLQIRRLAMRGQLISAEG